jgi:hypothetical protein
VIFCYIMWNLCSNFCTQVTSKKDQEQYWSFLDRPYRYIPAGKFAKAFRSYPAGKNLSEELDIPFDKRYNHPAALSTFSYGAKRLELLKTSFYWQRLLMKRNSFIYVFKFIQVVQVINYYHNLKSYPRILRCFG